MGEAGPSMGEVGSNMGEEEPTMYNDKPTMVQEEPMMCQDLAYFWTGQEGHSMGHEDSSTSQQGHGMGQKGPFFWTPTPIIGSLIVVCKYFF